MVRAQFPLNRVRGVGTGDQQYFVNVEPCVQVSQLLGDSLIKPVRFFVFVVHQLLDRFNLFGS